MLLDQNREKKNSQYTVGYDLGDDFSQISYRLNGREDVNTLPIITGTEQYNIPTVVCKRYGSNQWFYGLEALRRAAAGDGTLVDHLLHRAKAGEQVEIEGNLYDAVALLTIFLKRSLSLLNFVATLTGLTAMVITTPQLDETMIAILEDVVAGLSLPTKNIFFQSYEESFYHYMVNQPEELWRGTTLLFDYREDRMRIKALDFNRHTTPVVGIVTSSREEEFPAKIMSEGGQIENRVKMDSRFYDLVQEEVQERLVSSVYLIGDGFTGEWMVSSLELLCRGGRRIFQGNNLYSKGATYDAAQHLGTTHPGHMFLGKSRLKANIGMMIRKDGGDVYMPLLEAGQNWYDAHAQYDVYLEKDPSFTLRITPLTPALEISHSEAKECVQEEVIHLEGLPDRGRAMTRLRLTFQMKDVSLLQVQVEDLGFGEIFPATHQKWKSQIQIMQ